MPSKIKNRSTATGNKTESDLPPGVKLLRTFEGHGDAVFSVALSPQGETLASASGDSTVKLWDTRSGELIRTLEGLGSTVFSVAFSRQGKRLASGSADGTVNLWDTRSGKLIHTLERKSDRVFSVAFDPQSERLASANSDGSVNLWNARSGKLIRALKAHNWEVVCVAFHPTDRTLASGGTDEIVKLWDTRGGELLHTLVGHQGITICVAFHPHGGTLASGNYDNTVKLWDVRSGKLLRTLEAHTDRLVNVDFSPDGRLLASIGVDNTIRLWSCRTWETLAIISNIASRSGGFSGLAFHPTKPLLAAVGSEPDVPDEERGRLVNLWELDFDLLLGRHSAVDRAARVERSTQHRTAKVILVGDTGVGKSGLAHRLIHDAFEDTRSTHARRATVLEKNIVKTPEGVDEYRETVLWDLAGQPAYRLVHQLAMDDAAVACVLFDARSETNPLEGAAYWSQALDQARTNAAVSRLLVPARIDVGGLPVSRERIELFARERGFAKVFPTSAFTGEGCAELLKAVRESIPWNDLPVVSSTEALASLRQFIADLKGEKAGVLPLA